MEDVNRIKLVLVEKKRTNKWPLGVAAYKTKELIENLKSSLPGATDKPCGEGVRTLTQNCR